MRCDQTETMPRVPEKGADAVRGGAAGHGLHGGGAALRRLSVLYRFPGAVPAVLPDGGGSRVPGLRALRAAGPAAAGRAQALPGGVRTAGAAALFLLHAGDQRRGPAGFRSFRRFRAGAGRAAGRHDPGHRPADRGRQSGQHGHPCGEPPEPLSLCPLPALPRGILLPAAAADPGQPAGTAGRVGLGRRRDVGDRLSPAGGDPGRPASGGIRRAVRPVPAVGIPGTALSGP